MSSGICRNGFLLRLQGNGTLTGQRTNLGTPAAFFLKYCVWV